MISTAPAEKSPEAFWTEIDWRYLNPDSNQFSFFLVMSPDPILPLFGDDKTGDDGQDKSEECKELHDRVNIVCKIRVV